MKILKILLISLILLFSLGLVSAEDDGNFTALDNDIKDVIDAGENEFIMQKNYTFNTDDNVYEDGITISQDNFIINGNNNTINGNGQARIFNITGNNITIKNLNLINGKAVHGGAIYNNGNVTINNITFTENIASSSGGVIYNSRGSTIIINNSTFTNNQAKIDSGVIENYGTVIINNSTFTNNKAAYDGGIIFNLGNFTINNSTFINNSATNRGGVIYNGNEAILNVIHSIFYNNTANNGSAVYININIGIVNLSSNFWGNNTPDFKTLIYNRTSYILDDFINVNLVLDNNETDIGNPISYHVNITNNQTKESIDGNLLPNIILNIGDSTDSFIAQEYIINSRNYIPETTGVGTLELYHFNNLLDSANYEVIDYDYDFTWLNNTIYNSNNGIIDLKGKHVKYNQTKESIFEDGIIINKTVSIFNGTVDGMKGARIFDIVSTGNLTLENITLQNGTADRGGAIYNNGNLTIISGTFTQNTATSTSTGGGVIYNTDGTVTINNGTFTENTATNSGVIYNIGGTVTIENGIFTENKAEWGGVIYNTNSGTVTIENGIFTENTVLYSGGIIYNTDGNVIIENSAFTNNDAGFDGGAIYNNGYCDVITSTFLSNNATVGGAIYTVNALIVLNSTFKYNLAKNTDYGGGAICINTDSNVYINGTVFEFNNGTYGSAILNYQGNTTLSNNTFKDNSLKHLIFNNENAKLFLDNNTMNNDFNIEKIYNNGNITSKILLTIMNNNTVYYIPSEDVILNATLTDDKNNIIVGQNITLINTNLGIIPQLNNFEDGVYNITFNTNLLGTFTISGFYVGGNNLTIKNGILANKANTFIDLSVLNTTYGETVNITYTLTPIDATGNLTVIIKNSTNDIVYNKNHTVNNSDIKIPTLDTGNYTVTITYNGNDKYIGSYNVTSFTVNKANITINTNEINMFYGENQTIELTIPSDLSGNMTLIHDGDKIEVPVNNSKAIFSDLGLSVGKHNITIYYPGNENYNEYNETIVITISKTDKNNITVNDINTTANEEQKVVVTLNPETTGNLTLTVNNETYTAKINNGTAIFDINDLGAGDYIGNITYNGDENFNAFSRLFNITITMNNVNLTSNDTFMFYRDGTKYKAVLLDSLGNPIEDQLIYITINGVTYNRTTDENGTVFLTINLLPKTYNVTAFYVGSDKYYNASVTTFVDVESTLVSSDLIKYFKNGTQYTVKLTDTDGNPLANKTIALNINGVIYFKNTTADGIATLNINLNPGNYTITANYDGLNISSKIEVLPTLTAKDLTKQHGGPEQYEMKVVDGTGKVLANQVVAININGVFYNKTTDSDGIARLDINLDAGSYIATATWNGYSTSNRIKVE